MLDVTPLSLGVETYGGVMTVLIPRNTTIPTSKSEDVLHRGRQPDRAWRSTCSRASASSPRTTARWASSSSTGIPPAPRGMPQIEVTFDIDVNGILNVKAKDKATGKENKVEIKGHSGLSKDEIERMKKEAEAHAAEDKKRRELVDLKNQAEALDLPGREGTPGARRQGRPAGTRRHRMRPQPREGTGQGRRQGLAGTRRGRPQQGPHEAGRGDLQGHRRSRGRGRRRSPAAAPGGPAPRGQRGAGDTGAKKGGDDVIDAEYEVK